MTNVKHEYTCGDAEPATDEETAQTARLRARIASRVAEAPDAPLLASALRRLQEADGISSDAMAALLQTDASGMDRLALCQLPRADRFAEDTAKIARYCGCEASALLSLLRRVDVLATFSEPIPDSNSETAPARGRQAGWWGSSSALVAARDTDDEDAVEPEADATDA